LRQAYATGRINQVAISEGFVIHKKHYNVLSNPKIE